VYLNINQSEFDDYIYRVISYDRFLELFDSCKNILVKPKLWDDTFENLTLKSKIKYPDGLQIDLDTHERLYGQCWTTSRASDAMWRIYSPDRKSVRIRTTIGKLLTSILIANADTPMVDSCIGRVKYLSESKIISQAKQAFSDNGKMTFGSLFRSLLVKRKAFSHEKEIRLIHLDWGFEIPTDDIYSYDIDPHQLISQVMIDPRISYEEFKTIKAEIEEKTGFKGTIKRSLLYRLPEAITVEMEQNIVGQKFRKHQSFTSF